VALTKLRHIFITHHHSDYNADYGNLFWLAWTAGVRGHGGTRAQGATCLSMDRLVARVPHATDG